MSDELIVLPKAAVEALIQKYAPHAALEPVVDDVIEDVEALLAAAKPMVDEAVTHAVTFSPRPDAQCFVETQALWEVPARGTYRMLLIAADAAEKK